MENNIIKFLKSKDYTAIRDIGQGGTGKTKLIKDETINETFVCKKYSTYYPEHQSLYYENFVNEIKILYKINHPNIVRVFSYYLYPEQSTGYILMEYIDGVDIEQYLTVNPNKINDLFIQTINGFKYLEERNILHRDIRPSNILISNDGIVKIIDFGFGKDVQKSVDYEKSITLNWTYSLPNDFSMSIYDFKTEVYFVGKLFERIIIDNNLHQIFKYKVALDKMIITNHDIRIASFYDVTRDIMSENAIYIDIPEDSPLPADDEWAHYYCSNPSDGPWIFANIMNAEKEIPGFMPFDALMINSVEKVQGREYKVVFRDSIETYCPLIKKGDRLPFKSRWNSYDFGEYNKYGRPDLLTVSYSKDVTFEGVKTTNSLLMLAPISNNCGRIIFRNCEMSLAPGAIITSSADGIHLGSNRFGVIIDNCEFGNSFDDLINTQTYSGEITKIINDYTYETSRDMFCSVGDEIKFFKKPFTTGFPSVKMYPVKTYARFLMNKTYFKNFTFFFSWAFFFSIGLVEYGKI